MDHLPDDVLLMVLSHLTMEELFSVRLVCKRFAPLALHPDLWRGIELMEPSDRHYINPAFCPVLRLAPCVARILVSLPPRHTCHCHPLFTSACAARSLFITIRDASGAAYAALLISRQRELGRLRALTLYFDDDSGHRPPLSKADTSVLFGSLVSTPDLDFLEIIPGGEDLLPIASSPRSLHPTVTASMTSLLCQLSPSLECFFNCMLATHSGTLESLEMISYDFAVSSPSTTALLLAQMPNLTELHCPIFPGMEAVAGCASLRGVTLDIKSEDSDTQANAPAAASFLRRAHQLRALYLEYEYDQEKGLFDEELITALASSGRSCLEELSVQHELANRKKLLPQLRELRRALHKLPALRCLKVNLEKSAIAAEVEEILIKNPSLNVDFDS